MENSNLIFWTFHPQQMKFDFLKEDRLICEDKRFLYVVMERVKGGELFEVGNWAGGADMMTWSSKEVTTMEVFTDSQFGWCGLEWGIQLYRSVGPYSHRVASNARNCSYKVLIQLEGCQVYPSLADSLGFGSVKAWTLQKEFPPGPHSVKQRLFTCESRGETMVALGGALVVKACYVPIIIYHHIPYVHVYYCNCIIGIDPPDKFLRMFHWLCCIRRG